MVFCLPVVALWYSVFQWFSYDILPSNGGFMVFYLPVVVL